MGAGASIDEGATINKAQAQVLAGPGFDEAWFDAAANSEGLVSAPAWNAALNLMLSSGDMSVGEKECTSTLPEGATFIDGRALANTSLEETRTVVEALIATNRPVPALAVVVVGHKPASAAYIKRKLASAEICGVAVRKYQLEDDASEAEVLELVHSINEDASVHGVIVQLPLPPHMDEARVTQAVTHSKDVDGFTHQSLGSLAPGGGEPFFCPCTPMGCVEILRATKVKLRGKEVVVGTPMALLLLREGCTVTVCHIDSCNTAAHSRRADILVVAVGKAGLVKPDWVKPGAVVIDVGINFVPDSSKKSGQRMVGDCHKQVAAVAGYLTPVPGGVGPMTVAMLMKNTVEACHRASLVSTKVS